MWPATFDLPDAGQPGDFRSCRLQRGAARLGFRSFDRLNAEPRFYREYSAQRAAPAAAGCIGYLCAVAGDRAMTQNMEVSKTMVAMPGADHVKMVEEETLVAELEQLGVRHIARQATYRSPTVRPPDLLLADLVRQPSARVRAAVIAVLLAHPEFASAVPAALSRLSPPERLMLRFFYTAACLLQEEYSDRLRRLMPTHWQRLPDLFSSELGLPIARTSRARLNLLGGLCQQLTGAVVNWAGTYEHVARQLLHQWEIETTWKK